jgi:hypothetical protein
MAQIRYSRFSKKEAALASAPWPLDVSGCDLYSIVNCAGQIAGFREFDVTDPLEEEDLYLDFTCRRCLAWF